MTNAKSRSVDLLHGDAAFVDEMVASGAYATAEEVVSESLAAMREREAEVEQWLRRAVAPAGRAIEADPSRAISAERVRSELRAYHDARTKRQA